MSETSCPPGGTGHCNNDCPFWKHGKCVPRHKAYMEEWQKEVEGVIRGVHKRLNKWEILHCIVEAIKATGILNIEEWQANAYLLAAAPQLHQELIEADRVICELCKRLNSQHENCFICADRESRLIALEKVTGK